MIKFKKNWFKHNYFFIFNSNVCLNRVFLYSQRKLVFDNNYYDYKLIN